MIDSIVLGAGPVGLVVTHELLRQGRSVLLADAGVGIKALQASCTVTSNIDYKNVVEAPSLRANSEFMWGGACMGYPLDYLSGSGAPAPLGRGELAAGYATAGRLFGIANFDYFNDQPCRGACEVVPTDATGQPQLERRFAYVIPDPRLRRVRKSIVGHHNLLLANPYVATRIRKLKSGYEVELVEFGTEDVTSVFASNVFVALGTVETSRLLMASLEETLNPGDVIGANLSDHLCLKIGEVVLSRDREGSSLTDYVPYRQRAKLWSRWSSKFFPSAGSSIDFFLYFSNFRGLGHGEMKKSPRGDWETVASRSDRARATEPVSADVNIFFEVPTSPARRLRLADGSSRTRGISPLSIDFELTVQDFDIVRGLVSFAGSLLKRHPGVKDFNMVNRPNYASLQTSNHPSGTYSIQGQPPVIDHGTLSVSGFPRLYALGAGLLPRAAATHPTLISAALAACAVSRLR